MSEREEREDLKLMALQVSLAFAVGSKLSELGVPHTKANKKKIRRALKTVLTRHKGESLSVARVAELAIAEFKLLWKPDNTQMSLAE